MPVQTGTATPWREVEGPSVEGGPSAAVYLRPGNEVGTADLLAEQMRADGLIPSLGLAIRLVADAALSLGWFGLDEDGQETLCDQEGWTVSGGQVDAPVCCVLAHVDLSEA